MWLSIKIYFFLFFLVLFSCKILPKKQKTEKVVYYDVPFDSCITAWEGDYVYKNFRYRFFFHEPAGFNLEVVSLPDFSEKGVSIKLALETYIPKKLFVYKKFPYFDYKNKPATSSLASPILIVQPSDTFAFAGCQWKFSQFSWKEKPDTAGVSPKYLEYIEMIGEWEKITNVHRYFFRFELLDCEPALKTDCGCMCGYKKNTVWKALENPYDY
jgi:hypothetical protein